MSTAISGAAPWCPGLTIAGRYRLRVRIGEGGAAEVWRALDTTLEAPVAIKLLHPDLAHGTIAKRFLREAKAAAKLRSLHVVQILDAGLHDDTAYITMELLEGETLADRLDRVEQLPPKLVSRFVGHIAKAAAKAHAAQIVHRDLKPTNVFLVTDDDTDEIAKVFDFGIAKVKASPGAGQVTGTTTAGTLLGTPEYMSPEQARGLAVDYRTDLYAMGILAFESLTGRLPFEASKMQDVLQLAAEGRLLRPSQIVAVAPGFDAWFARATAFRAKDRFDSAKDLATALDDVLLLEG
ncbi:MAG: serine/threonine protein kinase [Polyangiaceae bacterium]|nr:serine/threonine protein kinase [Polyangiaceae bacterium]